MFYEVANNHQGHELALRYFLAMQKLSIGKGAQSKVADTCSFRIHFRRAECSLSKNYQEQEFSVKLFFIGMTFNQTSFCNKVCMYKNDNVYYAVTHFSLDIFAVTYLQVSKRFVNWT